MRVALSSEQGSRKAKSAWVGGSEKRERRRERADLVDSTERRVQDSLELSGRSSSSNVAHGENYVKGKG